MRTISLKLPDELLVELEKQAKARQVTKSWLIRESIDLSLRAYSSKTKGGSCYDLARDLAGSIHGLPKDLADNSKYMEGFGE